MSALYFKNSLHFFLYSPVSTQSPTLAACSDAAGRAKLKLAVRFWQPAVAERAMPVVAILSQKSTGNHVDGRLHSLHLLSLLIALKVALSNAFQSRTGPLRVSLQNEHLEFAIESPFTSLQPPRMERMRIPTDLAHCERSAGMSRDSLFVEPVKNAKKKKATKWRAVGVC